MRNKDNEVGVIWKNTDKDGREYLAIKLNLEDLLRLTGGATDPVVSINAYEVRSEHPKAPDYSLKYYPPRGGAPRVTQVGEYTPMPQPRAKRPQEPPPPDDGDDIPW